MSYEAKTIKRESLVTKQAAAAAGAEGTDTDFWTPVSGKRVFLSGLHLYATAAVTITIYSKTGVTKTTIFKTYGAANGLVNLDFGSDIPFTVDHLLGITVTGAAGSVEVNAWGYEK